MINNDVLRSIRYMLDLSDARVIEIIQLSDPDDRTDPAAVANWLLREDQPGFVECGGALLGQWPQPPSDPQQSRDH